MSEKILSFIAILTCAVLLLQAGVPSYAQDRLLDTGDDFLLGTGNDNSDDGNNDDSDRLLEPEPKGDALYQKRAEEFYSQCTAKPIIRTNDETDKAFCACAASQMYAWLRIPVERSVDEEFFAVEEEKTADTNTLISKIYGPCLHMPVFEIRYDECYYNTRNEYFMSDNTLRHNTCLCTAQGDAEYFELFAGPYLELQIAQGKKVLDPLETVKQSPEYYDHNYHLQSECYKKYIEQQ